MFNIFLTCTLVCLFSLFGCAQQKITVQISKENAEILKKNEALKPPYLPQQPIVAKEKSDAEDEGLKGKVKQVIEERESSSGSRKLSDVMFFDERGSFLDRDYFDSMGSLFNRDVWLH